MFGCVTEPPWPASHRTTARWPFCAASQSGVARPLGALVMLLLVGKCASRCAKKKKGVRRVRLEIAAYVCEFV